jgi:hypothetical protein
MDGGITDANIRWIGSRAWLPVALFVTRPLIVKWRALHEKDKDYPRRGNDA